MEVGELKGQFPVLWTLSTITTFLFSVVYTSFFWDRPTESEGGVCAYGCFQTSLPFFFFKCPTSSQHIFYPSFLLFAIPQDVLSQISTIYLNLLFILSNNTVFLV